jgi:winged helix DNA-binding protein
MQDVAGALNESRSIVRTWLMRGTLHLIAADDLGWLLGVLGPIFAGRNQARRSQLGLGPDTISRGVAAIRRILGDAGPLTRYEIVARLHPLGVALNPGTQAPIHLVQVAALQGVLCLGAERDNGEPTYVLIDDWIGKARPKEAASALAELARRYLAAFGPATPDDFVAWSGLPTDLARSALSAISKEIVELPTTGQTALMIKGRLSATDGVPAKPAVRLLPAFDTYLLGYRHRDLAVPAGLQRRLQRGGGWLHPAITVDGRVVGAWTLQRSGGQGEIAVDTLNSLTGALQEGLQAEVADIGRFLNLEVGYRVGAG